MNNTPSVYSCKVDWLTLTATDPNKRSAFLAYASALLARGLPGGNDERPWKWKGYHGVHCGELTYGRRDDSDIIQLSSALAEEQFKTVWPLADHCTRIDLAVDVKVEEEVSTYIGKHNLEANEYRESKRPALSITCIENNRKPATLYIGSRVSDIFARIYDKYLECGLDDYRQTIRYELEIKGDPAQRTFTSLGAAPNRAAAIASGVRQYLVRRGIEPQFSGVDGAMCIQSVRASTDDASRLAWLSSGVRPAIVKLLQTYKPETLLAALGFPRSLCELARLRSLAERGHHFDPLNEWEDDLGDSTE